MIEIEKDYGKLVIDENGLHYIGDHSQQGIIYKDYQAFQNKTNEICYIAEYQFETNDTIIKTYCNENGSETVVKAETYWSIRDQVAQMCKDYRIKEQYIDHLTEYVFQMVDWQHISTFLDDLTSDADILASEYFEDEPKADDNYLQ